MSDDAIFETEQYRRDIETLARAGRSRLLAKLHDFVYPQLRQRPQFGPNIKKLKGFEPDTWRYRVGDWRFFYEIDEQERIVLLTAAAHRGSAY